MDVKRWWGCCWGELLYRGKHIYTVHIYFVCLLHQFVLIYYSKSTETILLTVWSGSLLTWWWDNSKQGQSKSNPPATRYSFGKLYSGKWAFLSHLLWLFLFSRSFSNSIHHFYCTWSQNSPVSFNHYGNHIVQSLNLNEIVTIGT